MIRRAAGFTLIELMVTIGVAAILMLIALPSYLDRIAREQVGEALPLANVVKPAVQAAWAASKSFPADNAAANLPPPEKIVNEMVTSVALDNGAIHITLGNRAGGALRGRVVTLRPAVVEDTPVVPMIWLCGHAAPPPPMVAKGTDRTNVPNGYLPVRCR